jgi:hypothetical protein
VVTGRQRRRGRSWWRLRRLIAAVLCVDLLGAALFVYALSRPLHHSAAGNSSAKATTQPPGTATPVPAATTPASGRLVPATSMPSPSMSRAPALPADTTTNSAASATTPALDANAQVSFANLVTRLGPDAHITIAIQPLGRGRMEVLGGDPGMQAMSTSKILILAALLRDKGGVNNLTPEQMSLARAAVTQSDNDAILALFRYLEADNGGLLGASAYATNLLRKVGDQQTEVTTAPPPPGYATTFGQTPWTPAAEVRFFRALALGCILPPPDTNYELGLMRNIEPSESFGLGSAGFQHVAYKGGWGPEPGDQYGVRQTGIIGSDNSGVVVSLTADPVSTFAIGQSMLDQVAQWLHREVRFARRPAAACPT